MRTIGLIALLFLLTLMPAACGDDHSITGNNDSDSPITCEDVCDVAVQCYHEAGEILDYYDCVSNCIKHDKIKRFPKIEQCVVDSSSCEEYWECHED